MRQNRLNHYPGIAGPPILLRLPGPIHNPNVGPMTPAVGPKPDDRGLLLLPGT